MASSSPVRKTSAAPRKDVRERAHKPSSRPPKSGSLSPTAASEALQALKTLASPDGPAGLNSRAAESIQLDALTPTSASPPVATDTATTLASGNLWIQAPPPPAAAGGSLGGAVCGGPSSVSPASGISAPTSPADDGLDTPDGLESSAKRRRLADADAGTGTGGGASPATPPLFLEKTYEMLDKCSPQVACWSLSGDSFIVKNPVAFAEHVIPIYFKHKNFSSFVRQLNFYGFRKVRVVDPETTGGVDPKDWWEFRHDKFLRGRKALLQEIKRRSMPSHAAGGSAATGQSDGRATIDRAEIDELRTEVSSLREQIHTLNKHMFSVMQIMMVRNAGPAGPPSPFVPPPQQQSHQPHQPQHVQHLPPQYAFPAGLPPPHGAAGKTDKQRTTHSPSTALSGGYALRPLQSIVGPGVPVGYPYPVTPSGDYSMDWEMYTRHAYHAAQTHAQAQAQAQQQQPPPTASGPGSSTPQPAPSSVPAVPGLKRTRSQQKTTRSPLASSAVATAPVNVVENPEAAVRHMSMLVTQIRGDLLASILGRTLAFIRVQPSSSSKQSALQNPEIDAIAEAIAGDIEQRLVQVNEVEAATHGRPLGSAPSETSHMYRVEMLKFVSKELPRAMSEAVEKGLPAATKKSLNRSLLALMVQKAQAALENQMRVETASSASPSHANGKSN